MPSINQPISRAVLLSTGDELTFGQIVDTNSAWLSRQLMEYGVVAVYHLTVPDDLDAIVSALQEAAHCAELVLVTGGLGPTKDDLGRQALAQALGCELVMHQPSLERIERFFRERGRDMPEGNLVQAMRPAKAEVLDNDWGTAPGLKARLNDAEIIFMPGVPSEMRSMFACYVAPNLAEHSGRVILTSTVWVCGMGESTVAGALGELMARDHNPVVGTTAADGLIAVRVRSESATETEAKKCLDATVQDIKSRLGINAFGCDNDSLPAVVGRLMAESGRILVTAESCTGGLIGAMLTSVPGASAWYQGGWITYANDAKIRDLAVPPALLKAHGAVSEQVVSAMASGALRASKADVSLALSGIAGPDGGSPEKPVGTVWIAMAVSGKEAPVIFSECLNLPGNRDSIRDRAAKYALNFLRIHLISQPAADAGCS